jgi:hypothetical protein
MAEATTSPRLAIETKFCPNYRHHCIVVFSIVQGKIADFLLDFVVTDDIKDLATDIVAVVPFRDFRESQNKLTRLIILVSKERSDSKEGISVSRSLPVKRDIDKPWSPLKHLGNLLLIFIVRLYCPLPYCIAADMGIPETD